MKPHNRLLIDGFQLTTRQMVANLNPFQILIPFPCPLGYQLTITALPPGTHSTRIAQPTITVAMDLPSAVLALA